MLCRIFQKSGLGPPNGDRYAPFIEEEWNDDAPMVIPGEEEPGYEMVNADDSQVEGNDFEQVCASPYHSPPQLIKFVLDAIMCNLVIFSVMLWLARLKTNSKCFRETYPK